MDVNSVIGAALGAALAIAFAREPARRFIKKNLRFGKDAA